MKKGRLPPRKESHAPVPAGGRTIGEWAVLGVILTTAAILLFWRLGAVYLWQDEANTAVLASRMLKFGKPLAYDQVNLLSNDNFDAEDQRTISRRTISARAGLDYVVARGDLKPDTAWTYQPWGQFVAAGASIAILGHTTVAARVPFAIAAFGTILGLYLWARRATGNPATALMASALLVANGYWILHGRQARYYALSSLGLMVTLIAYERWCRSARLGAASFVVAAWCWFQIDYGTVWPVLLVLFLHAAFRFKDRLWQAVIPAVVLAIAVAPFVSYYQLQHRLSVQVGTWSARFGENLSNLNQFVVPIALLVGAASILVIRRRRLAPGEQRVVVLSVAILAALAVWVPSVAPAAFLRYVVMATPLGCFVAAWLFVGLAPVRQPWLGWVGAAVLIATPWFSTPLDVVAPPSRPLVHGVVFRAELSTLIRDVFKPRKDPNRMVVEWLKQHANPTDEILINYEDAPLMYYLPNPIRGGIAAFRAEDDSTTPPAFAVIRRSVPGVHWPVFIREVGRYQWDEVSTGAPDIAWGNNPDPIGKIQDPDVAKELFLARRRQ